MIDGAEMSANNFICGFTYIPPFYGGEIQEKQPVLNGGIIMNEILEEYKLFLGMKYQRKNSQIRYLNSAQKFLEHVQEISEGEIQKYVIYLNRTQRPNSVTSNIVGLNRFLEYLKRSDLRVSTPAWKPIIRDTINREEIVRLIRYAKDNIRYMDYLILLMVRDLDCRNHEIVKTRWDWIHGDKIFFKDCKTGDTVGRLTPDLKEALQHWRDVTPHKDNPFVFTVQKGPFKGRPLAINGWYVRNLVNWVSTKIIGRRLNPQDLRASVITAEYTAYVNPKIIQLKARHRNEKTTQRYNHIDESLVATYIESGTIFSTDTETVLKAKPLIREDKRGYINSISFQEHLENETDNSEFSFSYSFSFFVLSVTGVWGDAGLVMSSDALFASSPPVSSLSVTLFSCCRWPCFSSPYSGCWLMGRWVIRDASLGIAASSTPYDAVVESSFPPARLFCADERAIGGFFVFHNFSSLMILPWSFQGAAAMFCQGSTPCSGVFSSEWVEDGGYCSWRSNPGQVRALEYVVEVNV
jgi:integrase